MHHQSKSSKSTPKSTEKKRMKSSELPSPSDDVLLHAIFRTTRNSFLGQSWPKNPLISKSNLTDLRPPETPKWPPKVSQNNTKNIPSQSYSIKPRFLKNVSISIIKTLFLRSGEAVCKLKIITNNLQKRKNKKIIEISNKKASKNQKKAQKNR